MVQERYWKENVVYLYGFGRSKTVPCISPFSLKLETFLRLHKIPYENRFVVLRRSKHGLLPYIELNGEKIEDSQIIIERLKKEFNIQEFPDAREDARNRAIQRMVENHTFFVVNKFKIVDKLSIMSRLWLEEQTRIPSFLVPLASLVPRQILGSKAKNRQAAALGMYSDEDFRILLLRDFQSLRDLLGENAFFSGDKLTSTDCSVFGILAPALCIPVENYAQQLLQDQFPSIVAHIERVREELWRDDFEMKE